MSLHKSDLTTLVRFFRDGSRLQLKASVRLRSWIDEHFDAFWNGKAYQFTVQTKRQFRAELQKLFPAIDFVAGLSPDVDRLAMSKVYADEKWANQGPEFNRILVTTKQGDLSGYGIPVSIPSGCCLRISIERLTLRQITHIIVVENLDILDNWHKVILPNNLSGALAVYRGHESTIAQGVKQLLSTVNDECEVIAFTDLDPAGLQIALGLPRCCGILSPTIESLNRLIAMQKNQPKKYLKQLPMTSYTGDRVELEALRDYMNRHQVALMQQHFVAQDIALMFVPL